MAADTDRCFRNKPLLAGFRSARVVQNPAAVQEDCIGDDLLERGVLLGGGARREKIILRLEKGGQVVVNLSAKALKTPKLVEKFPLHHQDVFLVFAHGGRDGRSGPQRQGKSAPH